MINKLFSKIILIEILLLLSLTSISFVSAADWYKGELHVHTDKSSVLGGCIKETPNPTGYSVSELAEQAINLGSNFQSYTDHSYCLDSSDFNDVESECNSVDNDEGNYSNFTCLSGEELSVKDNAASSLDEFWCVGCLWYNPLDLCPSFLDIESHTRAAHLGAHGIDNFISQSSSYVWCPDSPNTQPGIDSIGSEEGLSIINHPYAAHWDFESINYVSDYDGIEIWNGEWDDGGTPLPWSTWTDDKSATEKWIELLLDGEKIFAYGGTDTHDEASDINVNYAYLSSLTASNLKTALKEGYSSVSNTGEMYIEIYDSYNTTWEYMGRTFNVCDDDVVNISVTYNIVLGYPCNLRIYKGEIGGSSESYWDFGSVVGPDSDETQSTITTDSYFRAECINSTEDKRIFTNPIWIELAPDVDGDGYCTLSDCDDTHGGVYPGATEICDDVDNDCDDVIDEGCEGSEPPDPGVDCNLTECNETGYDHCIEYSCDNGCDVKIAVNHYSNVNNIGWGAVNDSSDPYVINNYTFGWKAIDADQMYYDVNNPGTEGEDDCYYGGCRGLKVENESTMATVNSPGIAYREIILGYEQTGNYACWVWFNDFYPYYTNDPYIYVLNCFNESDCQNGYYCDKTGSWPDWDCVLKKGGGQNCSSDSECLSGYCDNDGVGLADDGWCFTPYNAYFDSQDPKYCEYSTGSGDVDCDEKQIGNGCGADCEYSINAPVESTMLHPNESKIFETNTSITINWTLSTDLDNDFIRYFLQYSNNSVNWTNIFSNYGYENKLNDSSTEKVLNFSGNENQTIYIRLPKKAKVSHARLDLGGLPV